MISDLYAARIRMYHATPGSREWWRAIRQIRSAKQALTEMVQAIGEALRGIGEALSGIAETIKSVNTNLHSKIEDDTR